jgi:hypothetical protein
MAMPIWAVQRCLETEKKASDVMTPVRIPNDQHVQLFESLKDTVRGLAQLSASHNDAALRGIDRLMTSGAMVRLTFSVGSAGPLSLQLHTVHIDGSAHALMTIDAPPSNASFSFALQQNV